MFSNKNNIPPRPLNEILVPTLIPIHPAMFTAHEILGFMSPALALEIVDYLYTSEKEVYRAALQNVAEARKVRPVFFERKPRAERHQDMVAALSKPRLELVALNVLQTWLVKKQTALLAEFLDGLGIVHQNGVVESLPATIADEKLGYTIEALLAKHPREIVAVYLHAFSGLNEARWPNLAALLDKDERLQLGA